LFKLNFDTEITGLYLDIEVPEHLQEEARAPPVRIYAYADDGNLFINCEPETLRRVRWILEQFGSFSGLQCNIEKTTLIMLGSYGPVNENILNVGFNIEYEGKVLGMKIGKNYIEDNASEIHNKLISIKKFWSCFNLSLPGRIAIAKSLLYSQINYLGCFIPFTENQLDGFEKIIENFVRKNRMGRVGPV